MHRPSAIVADSIVSLDKTVAPARGLWFTVNALLSADLRRREDGSPCLGQEPSLVYGPDTA